MANSHLLRSYLVQATIIEVDRTRFKLDYMGARMNSPRFNLKNYVQTTSELMISDKYKYSPDLISHDYYGTPQLWWVICRYNGILNPLDPLRGIVPGIRLKIPALVDVRRWLQAVSTSVETASSFVKV